MNVDESMLDAYIYETQQLLEALENTLLEAEQEKKLTSEQINEVFRIMHTIKGASAMMEFEGIAGLSHILEDLYDQIREFGAPVQEWPTVFDLTFSAVSFFNTEMAKLLNKQPPDADASELVAKIKGSLHRLKDARGETSDGQTAGTAQDSQTEELFAQGAGKPCYKLKLFFEEGCRMEALRAFGVLQNLKKISQRIVTQPQDLNADSAPDEIIQNGVCFYLETEENPDQIKKVAEETLFVKSYSVLPIVAEDSGATHELLSFEAESGHEKLAEQHAPDSAAMEGITKQNFISVNVNKLDHLLNIVGEIVTAQSMVINSANFGEAQQGSDNFETAAQQLHGLINELQDVVMSIRMIPVSTLFQKMRRLVRDMSKRFDKNIELELVGEETEVDKNVIDYLADPLLHIMRNSVDHGIEDAQARLAAGKPARGTIRLEARTTGSDVIVTISDDGQGLQRDKILKKAYERGLISRIDGDIPDKDVYNLIFLPGFSTNDTVTEYSGRGVGMDVVRRNISQIGGNIVLESQPGQGTTHIIRIPLTLTIVNGMKFSVGDMNFLVPTVSVLSVVQPDHQQIFTDSLGNEMMMLHGECYELIRLSNFFGIENAVKDLNDGMIMHIAAEGKKFCIFFDQLDGEYQVVVKALPGYLQKCASGLEGLGGCAILGDGSINLILDVNNL